MDTLFIHNNFPGQFKTIAPSLVQAGHRVVGIGAQRFANATWNGVHLAPYDKDPAPAPTQYPWIETFINQNLLGRKVYDVAIKLKKQGFSPKVIIAHPSWGESLFIKDVWPDAKLGMFCEYYFHPQGHDITFDPEFFQNENSDIPFLRIRNMCNELHMNMADGAIAPTEYQKNTYPEPFRSRIFVNHDGIDTQLLRPSKKTSITIRGHTIKHGEELITFINRNLEPARGFHVFMRILPELLRRRPNARVIIIGGSGQSYCGKSPDGRSWRDIFSEEIRQQMSTHDWERIHFVGCIPYAQYIAVMQLSSVHVYLTYPFVLSWSVLEAMSLSCALVGSATAPLLEMIKHNETGMLVDYFDKQTLTNTICELLADPKKRAYLGKNAREHIIRNYDLTSICLPTRLQWIYDLASTA